MEYTTKERQALIGTCRKWTQPLAVEKAFDHILGSDKILDYGCGMYRTLQYKLRELGYDAHGYDLAFHDTSWGREGYYDVVIASNVLNVQPDAKRAVEVLEELGRIAGRLIIFNYPNSPRKWKCTAKMLRVAAKISLPEWDLKHEYYGSGTLTVATRKEGS